MASFIIWLGVKDALSPTQRVDTSQPVFTIGDIGYLQALRENKRIIKFGPMFWGLYPGGLAFSTPDQAAAFIHSHKDQLDWFSSGWAVYELSGDFNRDTREIDGSRYLNRSLFITGQVQQPQLP